jgi:hypothetical protein
MTRNRSAWLPEKYDFSDMFEIMNRSENELQWRELCSIISLRFDAMHPEGAAARGNPVRRPLWDRLRRIGYGKSVMTNRL